MKRITVPAYHVALVFRNERLVRVLTEGKYWMWFGCEVQTCSVQEPFTYVQEMPLYLENAKFRNMIDVIHLRDNELAIQFYEGNFESILPAGHYAYWKQSGNTYTRILCDMTALEVQSEVPRGLMGNIHLNRYMESVSIAAFESGLLYVNGVFTRILEPGVYYFWKYEKAVQVIKADLRKQQLEISGQEILTRDKAAIRVNFQAQYMIIDAVKAMVETKDYAKQLYILLQLALREYAGMLTLDEILSRKEDAQASILTGISAQTTALGVELLTCGIRDIILPGDVKDIMNQVLIAEKKAQANVITRREETASTRSLLNTAKLLEDNAMLYKLKEMEYVEKIAEKINSISVSGGSQIVDQLRQIFVKQ